MRISDNTYWIRLWLNVLYTRLVSSLWNRYHSEFSHRTNFRCFLMKKKRTVHSLNLNVHWLPVWKYILIFSDNECHIRTYTFIQVQQFISQTHVYTPLILKEHISIATILKEEAIMYWRLIEFHGHCVPMGRTKLSDTKYLVPI